MGQVAQGGLGTQVTCQPPPESHANNVQWGQHPEAAGLIPSGYGGDECCVDCARLPIMARPTLRIILCLPPGGVESGPLDKPGEELPPLPGAPP